MRLIDADALLEELRKSCKWHAENSRELSILQRDISIVQEQPTIGTVPVKYGNWVVCDTDKWESIYALRCSECSGGFHLNHEDTIAWRYCPDCGARMYEV